ncbi:MAG TPA: hypothetical protein VNB06_17725 [Thermoanaerobaculia bacterium]|nr:hypothetical protein [Thermoanaerobaculia bacterium]
MTTNPKSTTVAGDDVQSDEAELRFLGPLITVENVEDHIPLLAHVFGLEARAIQQFEPTEVHGIWGVEGRGAGSVLLETGESRVGVRLIQFGGTGADEVSDRRRPALGDHPGRELRFLTRDFELARHVVERSGFAFRSVSRFSAPGLGRFTEARLAGPDGLTYAVLRMHDQAMERWVRISDRLFGELLAVAIPVADLPLAAAFYDLIGLQRVTTGPTPASSSRVAISDGVEISDGADPGEAVTDELPVVEETSNPDAEEVLSFGSEPRAPLLTLVPIVAGPIVGTSATLEESLVKRRGVVALRFQSASIEPTRRKLWSAEGQSTGARVLALGRGILEPMGAVESMLVRGPGGLLHQFLGRL